MPEQKTPIEWEEIVEMHNHMHKTKFRTPQEMLTTLYKQEGTLAMVGRKLGYSRGVINKYMKKWGLPRLQKGHRGHTKIQDAYRGIKRPGQYMHKELAKMLNCHIGYINHLKKSIAKHDGGEGRND